MEYCKNLFETNETVLRTFSENDCWKHFTKTCHELKPSKVFNISSLMKQYEEPIKDCNIKPPTYNEKKNKIIKMKSSGSSCPINQVSTLMLKKFLILRTIVWKICCYCRENNHFLAKWKNSTTILIHKKDNTEDPSNFRPIALELILSKVMTPHIRNRIFTLVVENNYVETNIEKGFWSNISGIIEYTELLTNILKTQKTSRDS